MSRRTLLVLASLAVALVLALQLVAGDEEPASRKLERLLDDAWQQRLENDPLLATQAGVHGYNHLLPQVTEEDYRHRRSQYEEHLERLAAIDRDALSRDDQIDYDIFRQLTEGWIGEIDFHAYRMPLTAGSGFHTDFPQLPDRMPLATLEDYEDYVSRLEAFLEYTRQNVGLMRKGLETGHTLPRIALEGYEAQVRLHIVDDPTESLLYAPFEDFPDTVPEADRERLEAAGRKAIQESVVPAYRELDAFLGEEYLPATRTAPGASELPRGKDFYTHRIEYFTSLPLTPQEVHETGLAEVARIRREMDRVIEETGFEGDFDAFVEFLRTDEQFYAKTPEELLRRVSWVVKQMDGKLPELFGRLPRTPYGVKPVPDYLAPKIYTAYYEPPAGDGSRAGYYAVNTYNLPSRPLYEIEALSFHEAVPGHHLQIALQQEIEDLHDIRRFEGFTAFTEGWALYSERLGLEAGFYEDPYSDFGRLSYEMWRALRLAVDTGIHALGWSRQKAIDYMAENSALSVHNITTEVDRYISWPGQALAYKTGELEIRRLRAQAEDALGARFDLRGFHDVVLGSGAVPLPVLEDNVERWIEEQSEANAS